ncbi:hypothetical protein EXW96_05780 [Paenibacillus sp. JMULE4]|uniref:hypothetical protein n=1 Tax=Paenibacillus sp. JMULE4 TaxID=2518342 RepID=UPI001575BDBC|nr:hypothetical protein [Paenibacillus sp. JMULE4]NTZ17089.1 hypothetical protein [Paenibacillus sp. JMULE4]
MGKKRIRSRLLAFVITLGVAGSAWPPAVQAASAAELAAHWAPEFYQDVNATYGYLPAWAALTEALLACRDKIGAAGAGWLERFHQLSNHDSSVYLLTRDEASGDGGVLFGGDLLEEGWKRLAQRLQLRCRVWKAPHHGVNDAFNAATLRLTRPEVAIIPICSERAQALQAQWTSLASEELGQGVQLRITGDVPPGTSKLITDGDILVYIG